MPTILTKFFMPGALGLAFLSAPAARADNAAAPALLADSPDDRTAFSHAVRDLESFRKKTNNGERAGADPALAAEYARKALAVVEAARPEHLAAGLVTEDSCLRLLDIAELNTGYAEQPKAVGVKPAAPGVTQKLRARLTAAIAHEHALEAAYNLGLLEKFDPSKTVIGTYTAGQIDQKADKVVLALENLRASDPGACDALVKKTEKARKAAHLAAARQAYAYLHDDTLGVMPHDSAGTAGVLRLGELCRMMPKEALLDRAEALVRTVRANLGAAQANFTDIAAAGETGPQDILDAAAAVRMSIARLYGRNARCAPPAP